jgi:hypothetical protein
MPHFVHSSRWWTGVSVLNPGDGAISVKLTAYHVDGTIIQQKSFSIPARNKLVGYVEVLLPSTANHSGWILVETNNGLVSGLLIYGDSSAVPNRIAAVPAVPGSTQVLLGNFFSDASWWTGIALVNPTQGLPAHVTLSAYAQDGALISTENEVIPSLSKSLGLVNNLFALGGETTGWVEANADVPVVGLEILNGDDAVREAFGLAGIESQPSGSLLSLPHYVVSSRWWTLFALANPHATIGANLTLDAYASSGILQDTTTTLVPAKGKMDGLVQDIFGW